MGTNPETGNISWEGYIAGNTASISYTWLNNFMSITLYRLDLYIPEDNSRPCPVVAFVTGGAWIIGLVLMIPEKKNTAVILGDYLY